MRKGYDKLVRDNVPEILERKGLNPDWYIEGVFDLYLERLDNKLKEELQEYFDTNNVSELGDLMDVIYAILEARGVDLTQFHGERQDKLATKGGFKRRMILKSAEEE